MEPTEEQQLRRSLAQARREENAFRSAHEGLQSSFAASEAAIKATKDMTLASSKENLDRTTKRRAALEERLKVNVPADQAPRETSGTSSTSAETFSLPGASSAVPFHPSTDTLQPRSRPSAPSSNASLLSIDANQVPTPPGPVPPSGGLPRSPPAQNLNIVAASASSMITMGSLGYMAGVIDEPSTANVRARSASLQTPESPFAGALSAGASSRLFASAEAPATTTADSNTGPSAPSTSRRLQRGVADFVRFFEKRPRTDEDSRTDSHKKTRT